MPKKLDLRKAVSLAPASGITKDSLQGRQYGRSVKRISKWTEEAYSRFASRWSLFSDFLGEPLDQYFVEGSAPPSPDLIKRFLQFYAATSEGRLTENAKVTTSSVQSMWQCMNAYIKRRTGKSLSDPAMEDINAFISEKMPDQDNIHSVKKKKQYANEKDLKIMLEHLWGGDLGHRAFPNERLRIQLALLIHIHFYTAGRPGSFLPDRINPNIALTYEKLALQLVRDREGRLRFVIIVRQDYMKGKKLDPSEYLEMVLHDSRINLLFCPVSLLLALGLADGAFEGYPTFQSLLEAGSSLSSDDQISIPISSRVKDRPVFRKCHRLKEEAYAYYEFRTDFESLSTRAGYSKPLRPYAIRGGSANKVAESKSESSAMQVFGHANISVFLKSYQNKLSNVDLQSLVCGSPEDLDLDQFRREQRTKPYFQPQQKSDHLPFSFDNFGDLRSPSVQRQIMFQYLPERERVWRAMELDSYDITEAKDVIETLTTLSRPRDPESKDQRRLSSKWRNNMYCFKCREMLGSSRRYRNHCASHLRELKPFCGILKAYGLLIIPGHCPFCLSDDQIDPIDRMRPFKSEAYLLGHINEHLEVMSEDRGCPLNMCDNTTYSRSALLKHFALEHKIGLGRRNFIFDQGSKTGTAPSGSENLPQKTHVVENSMAQSQPTSSGSENLIQEIHNVENFVAQSQLPSRRLIRMQHIRARRAIRRGIRLDGGRQVQFT